MTRLMPIALVCCTLVSGCNSLKLHTDPQITPFPGQHVATFHEQHCKEPSGIVFHRSRGTLFVVGDEGDICELRTDGTLLDRAHIRKTDLEGITTSPVTGKLYAIDEFAPAILEIDPNSLAVSGHISIGLAAAQHNGENRKRGFEAITLLADSVHPADSRLFIANQGRSDRAAAAVYKLTVPLPDSGNSATILQIIEQQTADLSGLHYDDRSGLLLLISDAHNTLLLMTPGGIIATGYALPGENQEGITLDDEGHLYIAEDSGNIVKYTFPAMLEQQAIRKSGRTR